MNSYEYLIYEALDGDTPREKYMNLITILQENIEMKQNYSKILSEVNALEQLVKMKQREKKREMYNNKFAGLN
jgi:hypothetical protein